MPPHGLGKKTLILLLLLIYTSGCSGLWSTFGISLKDLKQGLFNIATALSALMITLNGLKWITSSQPEERNECKKSISYIILALILVSSVEVLVDAMYKPVLD